MKNYEKYSVEDFIQDEDFRDWVQGLSREDAFWISFLQRYPEQKATINQAEQIIRAAYLPADLLSEKEIRAEVESFVLKAVALQTEASSARTEHQPRVVPIWKQNIRRAWAIAAMLVAVLGVAWYLVMTPKVGFEVATINEMNEPSLVETTNSSLEPLYLLLNDSSEVILSPKSSLRYPSKFTENDRIVYLTGEASFSVKHQGQTFMVRTGEMVTKVLGTKFVVSAFEKEKRITVQVLSGKVSVFRSEPASEPKKKEVSGLILTANQAAIFEKDVHQLTKTLVANPVIVSKIPQETEFRYDEVAMPEILHELEHSYGITIQFDEQSLRTCKITATLGNESLYEKLDLLCKTISANYEIVDGQIVLSGKGCR